jgi:ElaB/YqjD/DUF883 family membrane-anchored ribosome-binding protein
MLLSSLLQPRLGDLHMTDLNQVEQAADKAVDILASINSEAGQEAAEVKEGIEAEVKELKDAVLDFKSEESKENFKKEAMDVIKTAAAGDVANLPKELLEAAQALSEHNQVGEDVASAIKESGDVVKVVTDVAGVFADGKVTPDEIPVLLNAAKELAHDIPEAIAAGTKIATNTIKEVKEEVEEVTHSSWFQSVKSFFTFGWVGSAWNWCSGLFSKAPATADVTAPTAIEAVPEKIVATNDVSNDNNTDVLHQPTTTSSSSDAA